MKLKSDLSKLTSAMSKLQIVFEDLNIDNFKEIVKSTQGTALNIIGTKIL